MLNVDYRALDPCSDLTVDTVISPWFCHEHCTDHKHQSRLNLCSDLLLSLLIMKSTGHHRNCHWTASYGSGPR